MVDLFISLIQSDYEISLLKDRFGNKLKNNVLNKYIRLVKKYYVWQEMKNIKNAKEFQIASALRNFIVSYIYGDRIEVQKAMEFINNCISLDFK